MDICGRDWQALGQVSLEMKVLEALTYDKDESKTDYRDDLAILRFDLQEDRRIRRRRRYATGASQGVECRWAPNDSILMNTLHTTGWPRGGHGSSGKGREAARIGP